MKKNFAAPIICTGQMRAATTWLHETLRMAPGVWAPPVKELRFLLAMQELGPVTCSQRFSSSITAHGAPEDQAKWWQEVTLKPYLRAMSSQLRTWLGDEINSESALELEFWLRYFGEPMTFGLYKKLSSIAQTRRMLDVSPDYASLDDRSLRQIGKKMPDAKIILMLRNPKERLISQIRLDAAHGVRLDANDYIQKYLQSKYSFAQIHIDRHISRVIQNLSHENVFISFYNDVVWNANILLDRIGSFSDIYISHIPPPPQNSAASVGIPGHVMNFVSEVSEIVLGRLSQLLGPRCEQALASSFVVSKRVHSDTLANFLRH